LGVYVAISKRRASESFLQEKKIVIFILFALKSARLEVLKDEHSSGQSGSWNLSISV
jgi:hypothetical protein